MKKQKTVEERLEILEKELKELATYANYTLLILKLLAKDKMKSNVNKNVRRSREDGI